MRKSIERELDVARGEVAFWREFAEAAMGVFSPAEADRIFAAQMMAERRLGRLERLLARLEESDAPVYCVRRANEPTEEA